MHCVQVLLGYAGVAVGSGVDADEFGTNSVGGEFGANFSSG